ncbi:hypothetical protein [uncultured Gammaproteobacteria bacterium]|nr:hypothetical protein [uncultured Gammaproteobacteria bacterium]
MCIGSLLLHECCKCCLFYCICCGFGINISYSLILSSAMRKNIQLNAIKRQAVGNQ